MAILISADARDRRLFMGVLMAGFALRVAWTLFVPINPVSDSAAYYQLAQNLALHGRHQWDNGQLTAYWPVGTSFVYSLSFRVFGNDLAPLAAMNVLVGTATIKLIHDLAREWASRAAALLAAALYAFWPSQIEFTSVIASELWFNFFVLLFLCSAFVWKTPSWLLKGSVAGLFLAAAIYIRPLAIPLIAIVPLGLIWQRQAKLSQIALFTFAAGLVATVSVSPWTMRNLNVFGEAVIVSTNGPPVTWMGNNPSATGEYIELPEEVANLSEVERSRVLGDRAREFIFDNPGRFVELTLRKLVLTHNRETIGVAWNERELSRSIGPRGLFLLKLVSSGYWLVVLMLGLTGAIIVSVKQRWRALLHPAILGWVYFASVHAVTLANDRYHMPSIPFIAILAGIPVIAFWVRWRDYLTRRSAKHAQFVPIP